LFLKWDEVELVPPGRDTLPRVLTIEGALGFIDFIDFHSWGSSGRVSPTDEYLG
jgi:hypothetical protein